MEMKRIISGMLMWKVFARMMVTQSRNKTFNSGSTKKLQSHPLSVDNTKKMQIHLWLRKTKRLQKLKKILSSRFVSFQISQGGRGGADLSQNS